MLACSKSRLMKPCPDTVSNDENQIATCQKANAATVMYFDFVFIIPLAVAAERQPDPTEQTWIKATLKTTGGSGVELEPR